MGKHQPPDRITAFACWEDRIAPVFDTAREVLLLRSADDPPQADALRESLPEAPALMLVMRLAELGVGELVCGAVSRALQGMLEAHGITVRAFVAGELAVVVEAWRAGHLDRDSFTMPGCGGGGRRCAAGRGRGQGWMDGPRAAGALGRCVCPACGHHEEHERGTPCVRRACPQCGSLMTRG